MELPTLAHKLGTTVHLSPLLRKAARLGLRTARDLETLAVQRGCTYYRRGDEPSTAMIDREKLSDEELAIALLHLGQPWQPQTIRLGAAMLGASENEPRTISRLAVMERGTDVVRYIAECGQRYEPENSFWMELLATLPPARPLPSGVLPHPTRFVAMTGLTRRGREVVTQWIRPRPAAETPGRG